MKDSMEGHTRNAQGDHQRALGDLALSVPAAPGVVPGRAAVRLTTLQENACYIAYTCLKQGLSASDFQAAATSAYATGSDLPDAYRSKSFYIEMTDASSHVFFTNVLASLKQTECFAIAADEGPRGKDYLTIHVHYLDPRFVPHTSFWQVRKVFLKDNASLCAEVMRSFTESPDPSRIPPASMMTERDWARGCVGFAADGAPVMGTQRNSRPLAAPAPGVKGNLAFALLQVKRRHTEEDMLVAWCCPHRFDLVADVLEEYSVTKCILLFVRKVSSHIVNHASAKGRFHALHTLFTSEWAGGLASLHLAPHRF